MAQTFDGFPDVGLAGVYNPVISYYSGSTVRHEDRIRSAVTLTRSSPRSAHTPTTHAKRATVMSGTFTSFNCPSPTTDSGTLTLTKQ